MNIKKIFAGIMTVILCTASVNLNSITQFNIYADSYSYDSEQLSTYAKRVLELINIERAKVGVEPITMVNELNEVANLRAKEASTYFSHTRPDGTNWDTALAERGIDTFLLTRGENLSRKYVGSADPPQQVVESWMNSEGHRNNMLSSLYTNVGVGVTISASEKRYYWSLALTGDISFEESATGDVDGDGIIDASDASLVLAEYALLSTDSAGTFTEDMKKSADINNDGQIDSVDSSLILSYYSYTSTGGTDTIEKFLETSDK